MATQHIADKFLELDSLEQSPKKLKKKRRLSKSIILIAFQILAVIIVGIVTYYIYTKNKVVKENKVDVVKDVKLENSSMVDAEARNLANISKDPKTRADLTIDSIYTSDEQNSNYNYSFKSLTLNKNGSLSETKLETLKSYHNIISVSTDVLDNLEVKSDVIINSIINYAKTNSVDQIELDVSFTRYSRYLELIKKLSPELKKINTKLVIYLFPKWGDQVIYKRFESISNNFHLKMNVKELADYVDLIKVMDYDYVDQTNILPGPLTPESWFERVIQYYISEGVPRNKLSIGINTLSHEWEYREIAVNPLDNISVGDIEAKRYTINDFNSIINSVENTTRTIEGIDEKIYEYTRDGKKYIALAVTKDQIQRLEAIVLEYGVTKVFYR